MSEAGFKNNKDKFELNREPGRLPEDNRMLIPDTCKGESHTQENSTVELRGARTFQRWKLRLWSRRLRSTATEKQRQKIWKKKD